MTTLATHLWLDDIRAPPEGWTWCKTAAEAIAMLKTGLVEFASLDHDLGLSITSDPEDSLATAREHEVPTGYDVCKWMVMNDVYPKQFLKFHTANPVGRANMRQLISRYRPEVMEYRPYRPFPA